MKCPYNEFKECLIEKCPSCEYEVEEYQKLEGRYPGCDVKLGLHRGTCWYVTRKKYIFKSCKLVENGVEPAPKIEIENKLVFKPQTVTRIKTGGLF